MENLAKNAEEVIAMLGLVPLPKEGGFYRETYRSPDQIQVQWSAADSDGLSIRSLSTQILYMVTQDSFSALHRLKQDEVYHFYSGLPAELFLIFPSGVSKVVTLGSDLSAGQSVQIVVPRGTWQGVRLAEKLSGYSLMGTTVAPGFEFEDFELGDRERLIAQYPEVSELITKYTRADK